MAESEFAVFQKTVWDFYRARGRHELPWRVAERDRPFDPYKILVSEIMLQQTQVGRVIPKYHEFLGRFPDVQSLASAPLGAALAAWNGLGYNRRAKFLWQAAQMIVQDFGGQFPREVSELQRLPGVGANTAGAVAAYAFNQPVVFIETNIRTVFIHHFFKDEQDIPDKDIRTLVEKALPQSHDAESAKGQTLSKGMGIVGDAAQGCDSSREWYWALMDYGSHLKQTVGNLNRASKSYNKQSEFAGSRRQLRGRIIRLLLDRPLSKSEIEALVSDERLDEVLADLVRERLLVEANGVYALFAS